MILWPPSMPPACAAVAPHCLSRSPGAAACFAPSPPCALLSCAAARRRRNISSDCHLLSGERFCRHRGASALSKICDCVSNKACKLCFINNSDWCHARVFLLQLRLQLVFFYIVSDLSFSTRPVCCSHTEYPNNILQST